MGRSPEFRVEKSYAIDDRRLKGPVNGSMVMGRMAGDPLQRIDDFRFTIKKPDSSIFYPDSRALSREIRLIE